MLLFLPFVLPYQGLLLLTGGVLPTAPPPPMPIVHKDMYLAGRMVYTGGPGMEGS